MTIRKALKTIAYTSDTVSSVSANLYHQDMTSLGYWVFIENNKFFNFSRKKNYSKIMKAKDWKVDCK